MDRLVYDPKTKTIIARIVDCEGTVTGTWHEMVEDTPENIDRLIANLCLTQNAPEAVHFMQQSAPPDPAPTPARNNVGWFEAARDYLFPRD
jgi:hypothetical protein